MVKYFCDKCGREIGMNVDPFDAPLYPIGDEHIGVNGAWFTLPIRIESGFDFRKRVLCEECTAALAAWLGKQRA